MSIRSWMSLDLIGPERPEIFALEYKKIAIFDFVYSLTFTVFNQTALNLAKIYITVISSQNDFKLDMHVCCNIT